MGGYDDRLLREVSQSQHAIALQLNTVIALLRKGPAPDPAVHLIATIGPITKQGVIMQIHDNEQFDLTVSAVDSKGFPTADTFTATVDNADVASIVDNPDGTFTVVAGNPGSAVVTITDGTLSVTEAVDVVAGDAATISLAEGAPEDQPAAPVV